MTFPASDVGIKSFQTGFTAAGMDDHSPLEHSRQRAVHLPFQDHPVTGICPQHTGNWTGLAQILLPGITNQAALFITPASVIIAVEIFAFNSGRILHQLFF